MPRDVSELKSYLGLLSYYGKFSPNLSQVLSSLYQLLQKSTPWQWCRSENTCFQQSKEMLSSSNLLVHFNLIQDVILACDASSYGIGVVLAHRFADGSEKPIAYASRTMTTAGINYSQIEKEALACIFGVKKFHTYLYGHRFTLVTDHKPQGICTYVGVRMHIYIHMKVLITILEELTWLRCGIQ